MAEWVEIIPAAIKIAEQDARVLLVLVMGIFLWNYERQARNKDQLAAKLLEDQNKTEREQRLWLQGQLEKVQDERWDDYKQFKADNQQEMEGFRRQLEELWKVFRRKSNKGDRQKGAQ